MWQRILSFTAERDSAQMPELEPIRVPGTDKILDIMIEQSDSKIMRARIIDGHVVIKVPISWNRDLASRSAKSLYARMKRMVERHPELAFSKRRERMKFNEGETIHPLGRSARILVEEHHMKGAKALFDGDVCISLPLGINQNLRERKVSELARRTISKHYEAEIKRMVEDINDRWFKSDLGRIRIRDNTATWGTCSGRNDITLSLRLLFMPPELLEYVIVHELAHTKVRGHSRRFWSQVSMAMPDYMQRRRRLRTF